MKNKEVFIPLMSWLIGGSRIGGSYNIYTGSAGTDPLKGAIGQKIFNYRIWIEKNEEGTEHVKVAVYYGMSCFEDQNEDDIRNNVFELSEEGMAAVKQFVENEADEFFALND